jgi:hypothetical protein
MLNEQQKTLLVTTTIGNFFNQFGNDIYCQILMEELFKLLCQRPIDANSDTINMVNKI